MASNGDANEDKKLSQAMALLQQLQSNSSNMSQAEMQAKIQQITEQMKQVTVANAAQQNQQAAAPDLVTPQSQPLQGMKQHASGGFAYVVDDLTLLKRFIVLGSSEKEYRAHRKPAPVNTVPIAINMIRDSQGRAVIDTITNFAVNARVAREENILLILRECALFDGEAMYDDNTTIQRAAYDRVVKICNIPTKLFRFIELCEETLKKKWKPIEIPPSKSQLRKRAMAAQRAATAAEKEPVETIDEVVEEENKKKKKKKKKKKVVVVKPKKQRKFKRSTGWGRQRKRGIATFYTDPDKSASRLLLLLTKYKMRHNWSHKQVLTYVHPKMVGDQNVAKNVVIKYCTRGFEKCMEYIDKVVTPNCVDCYTNQVLQYIKVLEQVKNLSPDKPDDLKTLLVLLKEYGIRGAHEDFTMLEFGQKELPENKENIKNDFQLTREHLPTGFQKLAEVWEALLQDMPVTALIRNLGRMTSMGLFNKEENIKLVEDALKNGTRIRRARVHPIKILLTSRIYEQGHGNSGPEFGSTLSWIAHPRILQALDKAFYLAFKQGAVDEESPFSTGKKFMLCLDVSGSMTFSTCLGCPQLTPAVASFAMAMVTWNIEKNCSIYAFGRHLMNLDSILSREMTINEAMGVGKKLDFGSTDCALPMIHAMEKNLDIDVFIVYTDSETWCGRVHPSEALKAYRQKMNKPDAKLVVMAMNRNDVSIADPKDNNMMDIAGFDADVPEILYEFARGGMS